MIAVIRISGIIEIPRDVQETLTRLRIQKKFACVLVQDKPEVMGMINLVKNFVAYGQIDEKTLAELIEKRGRGKKVDAVKVAHELIDSKVEKKLDDFGLKPFFALHPPRGGIKSKLHFPRGVLGDHKEKINDLIRRML